VADPQAAVGVRPNAELFAVPGQQGKEKEKKRNKLIQHPNR
jgi:hypothetical protein